MRGIVLAILLSVAASLPAAAGGYSPLPIYPNTYHQPPQTSPYSSGEPVPAIRIVQSYGQYGSGSSGQGGGRQIIPPSVALRVALSYSPGSQGLGVSLLQGRRLMYAVKLKTGNRIHRVLVDAQTGQIVGD